MDIQKEFTTQIRRDFENQLTNLDFIIGVSGGVDSMTLAFLLLQLKDVSKDQLHIVHINHHLRAASDYDQKLVEEFCIDNNLDFTNFDWQPTNQDIENQAREFRYQSFAKLAKQFDEPQIVTAHHLDDQVETFLMKLIRGGDWRQLAGIQIRSQRDNLSIYRPLLNFKKKNLIYFANQHNLSWSEDQTNLDSDYTLRNKLRQEIIPELDNLNQKASEHIAEYAQQINQLIPDLSEIENLRLFVSYQVPDLPIKNDQLNQFIHLLNNQQKKQGSVQLANGYLLVKDQDKVLLQKL